MLLYHFLNVSFGWTGLAVNPHSFLHPRRRILRWWWPSTLHFDCVEVASPRRCNVTPSLIGWAQTENQPCIYAGVRPSRVLQVSNRILKSIVCFMESQCKLTRTGVMWSCLCHWIMTRATWFSRLWSWAHELHGNAEHYAVAAIQPWC